ncbi:hypothetical protein [Accumulibacter sp.]|uniref:hypothetical protein n=1 Tax=Accumulibacter sp. TaxID=2053492 RepID=UPI001A585CF8|nr:hypothetical protein [Accumulibacter sp.]MBL8376061.1 hypothetical protein [Accumulibacter sp.]
MSLRFQRCDIDLASAERRPLAPRISVTGAHTKVKFRNQQLACRRYACEHGIDLPEVVTWRWPW